MAPPPHPIEAHLPHLRRYARALCGRADQADDLVQETVLRALRRWDHFDGDRLRAWLFTILRHVHIDGLRRGRGAVPDAAAVPPSTEGGQIGGLILRDLERALAQLPDDQREVVLLIGLENMSYKEAAAVCGVALGTVMSRLARGRERLRQLMAVPEQGGRTTLRRVK